MHTALKMPVKAYITVYVIIVIKIRIKDKWIWKSHGAHDLGTRSLQSAAASCQHVLPSAPSFHR